MITDIHCRSKIKHLSPKEQLDGYWNNYFSFQQDAPELHALAVAALRIELDHVRTHPRPFLDAQRTIAEILTKFGSQHNFHRKFNERFTTMKPSQVLGMQLYALIVEDKEWWVYFPTQHAGHAFPHATYSMPRDDARYKLLVQQDSGTSRDSN